MARVTLKGAKLEKVQSFTNFLLIFPMISCHVVILSSFCAKSSFTIGALVGEKIIEMLRLNMISDTSDCFVGEDLANCADVLPRDGIFLHINV